ncbi:MAG: hypothetical protein RR202_10445 [Bacteroidales bacterium]
MANTKTFYEFYENIPNGEKKKIVNQYVYESEQAFGTFYRKLREKTFTRLEKSLIDKICGQEFFWEE